MHQRVAIQQALTRTGKRFAVSPGRDKAEAFFEMLNAQRDVCWGGDLVSEFRRNYYDALDEIVSVLFATDDPLIIFQCIRHADLSKPKEREFLREFIRECNPEKHQVSLRALAEKHSPELTAALHEKSGLPESVREVLARGTPT